MTEPIHPKAPRPRENESKDDYMERCAEAGHSEEDCEGWWDSEAKAPTSCYRRVLDAFYSSPWAILPSKLAEIKAFLDFKASGGHVSEEEVRQVMAARPRGDYQTVGRVAVLPLFGTIAQRSGMMTEASGGTSTEAFGAVFDMGIADKDVKCVCILADSPGGSVYGVPQLAEKIFNARGQKKIVAIADSMAASAAYWICSQASELYCAPGGTMGSIGVLASHSDLSGAEEKMGVKTTLVSAGKFKVEGSPYGPLDAEARAAIQSTVDVYYGQFVEAVAQGRGTTEYKVRKGFGEGRMLVDQDCVSAGLCDKVMSLEKLLGKYGGGSEGGGGGTRAEFDGEAWARQQKLRMLGMQE